ncbi:MAG: hypothetical protein JNL65_12665 [Saprospiraceae bacterium]|nr:hypothetical protein [Saprospiraceae bacterium]
MEFITNDNPWINGYPIHESYSLLDLKAFHLVSILNASMVSNNIEDLNTFLIKEYEMSEVSRILLEIAVQIRSQIDQDSPIFEGRKYNPNSITGKLTINPQSNLCKTKDLSFREACNKIIHAKHINFDLSNAISIKEYDSINPIIYLYGDLNGNEWKSQLDILKFISILICIKN